MAATTVSRCVCGVAAPSSLKRRARFPGPERRIQEDRWGRIPLEIACMHRWNWKKLHVALRTDYECSKEVLTPASVAPPARLAPGGGWLAPSGLSTVQPQCDFDMRENLTPLEFLVEYVTPSPLPSMCTHERARKGGAVCALWRGSTMTVCTAAPIPPAGISRFNGRFSCEVQ